MTEPVDSTLETMKHSRRVDELMLQLITGIQDRLHKHDQSKMEDPEKATFDEFSPKLKDSTYGSEEYKGFLAEMKVGLDHHYANNRHHPEHFEHGVSEMTLVDLVEMLADWKAAGERHENGSLRQSLEIQRGRFDLSDQLYSILVSTSVEMGWL